MTDLTLKRGDSRNYQVTITEDDNVTPIDLTDSIIKFSIKENNDGPNAEALVFKTSYAADEVEITDAVNGVCLVKLRKADTVDDCDGVFSWDLELSRQGDTVSAPGTIDFSAGEPAGIIISPTSNSA